MTGRVYQRDKSRRDVWQLIIEQGRDENREPVRARRACMEPWIDPAQAKD